MKAGVTARAGACLAGVQFCVAGCWTVQALCLPTLAAQAGLPAAATLWLSIGEAATVVVTDFVVGLMADRVQARSGRLGPAVVVSTLAAAGVFASLPFAAAHGSGVLLMTLLALWAAASSALRVPPFLVIGRRAPLASQPWLIGMSMLGLAAAGAMALGTAGGLPGISPPLPFSMGGAALAAAALGIAAAERLLPEVRRAGAGPSLPATAATPASGFVAAVRRPVPGRGERLAAALASFAAAAAFQIHVFVDSAPLYRRLAAQADVVYLEPVFWVGFGLFLLAAPRLIERAGASAVVAGGALVAAVASMLMPWVVALQLLVNLQFIAGCAWACVAAGAVALALALGRPGHEGRFAGALSSLFALSELARLAVQGVGSDATQGGAGVQWLPAFAWSGTALLVLVVRRRRNSAALSAPP